MSEDNSKNLVKRRYTFLESLVLVLISLGMLMYTIIFLRGDAHVPLILATSLISLYAVLRLGFYWKEIMR